MSCSPSRVRQRPTIRGTAMLGGWRGLRHPRQLVSKMATSSTLPLLPHPPHQAPHHPARSLILKSRVSITCDIWCYIPTPRNLSQKWHRCSTQLLCHTVETNQSAVLVVWCIKAVKFKYDLTNLQLWSTEMYQAFILTFIQSNCAHAPKLINKKKLYVAKSYLVNISPGWPDPNQLSIVSCSYIVIIKVDKDIACFTFTND